MKESSSNESNVPALQNLIPHEVAPEKVGNVVDPISPIKCADQKFAETSSKSILLSKLSKLKGKLRTGESNLSSVSTDESRQESMQTPLHKVVQVKTDQKLHQHEISTVIPVVTRDSSDSVSSTGQSVDTVMLKRQSSKESKTVKLKKILEHSEHTNLISQSDAANDESMLETHKMSVLPSETDIKHTIADTSQSSHCITLDSKMHSWISEVGTFPSQSHALCVHHSTRELERYVEECDYVHAIREIAAHVQATNTLRVDITLSMTQGPSPLQCKLERNGIDRSVIISDVLGMLGFKDISHDFELVEKSFVSRHDESHDQNVQLKNKDDMKTQLSGVVSSTKQSLKLVLPSIATEQDVKPRMKNRNHLRHLPTELSFPRLAVHNAVTEYTAGIKILTVQVVHQIITRMKRYKWKSYHLSAIMRSIVDYQCVEYKVPRVLKDADLQFVAGDVINAVLQDSRLKLVDNGELQLTQPMLSVYDKKAMSHTDATSPVLNQEEFYLDCIKRWSRDFSNAAITHINKTRRGYLLATVHDKIKDPLFRLPNNFTLLHRDRTKIAEAVIAGMKEDKRLAVDNVAFVLKSSYDRRQRMLSQRFVIYENNPSVTFYRPEDYLVYDDTYATQYEEDFAMEEFELYKDYDYGSNYGAYFDCYEPALLSEYTGSCDYSETTVSSPLVWSPVRYQLYAESTSPVLEEYFPIDTSTCQGSVSEGELYHPNRYWRRSQKERLTESGQDMDVLSTTKDEIR